MSGFSVDWLRLRAPLDARSRNPRVTQWIAGCLPPPVNAIDLGAGTGSNMRYLASRLGGEQSWLLVEQDENLLRAMAETPIAVRTLSLDLARELDLVPIPRGSLVTASALLDLTSLDWLSALVSRCAGVAAPVLFALSYDGRFELEPAEPEDAEVRALFNQHQRTDKGFGPALGPEAAVRTLELLERAGYEVESGPSDWQIDPSQKAVQCELLDGWYGAAVEMSPASADRLGSWRSRHRRHIDDGRALFMVGHVDVAGLPG